jgi:hypothetical protein
MARRKGSSTEGSDLPEVSSTDAPISGIETTDNSSTDVRSEGQLEGYIFVGYSGNEKQYRKI